MSEWAIFLSILAMLGASNADKAAMATVWLLASVAFMWIGVME